MIQLNLEEIFGEDLQNPRDTYFFERIYHHIWDEREQESLNTSKKNKENANNEFMHLNEMLKVLQPFLHQTHQSYEDFHYAGLHSIHGRKRIYTHDIVQRNLSYAKKILKKLDDFKILLSNDKFNNKQEINRQCDHDRKVLEDIIQGYNHLLQAWIQDETKGQKDILEPVSFKQSRLTLKRIAKDENPYNKKLYEIPEVGFAGHANHEMVLRSSYVEIHRIENLININERICRINIAIDKENDRRKREENKQEIEKAKARAKAIDPDMAMPETNLQDLVSAPELQTALMKEIERDIEQQKELSKYAMQDLIRFKQQKQEESRLYKESVERARKVKQERLKMRCSDFQELDFFEGDGKVAAQLSEPECENLLVLDKLLTEKQKILLENLFKDQEIDLEELKSLVKTMAKLFDLKQYPNLNVMANQGLEYNDSSHFKCKIPNTRKKWTIKEGQYCLEDRHLSTIDSWDFHGKSHYDGTLRGYAAKRCIEGFTKAGITPNHFAKLKQSRMSNGQV